MQASTARAGIIALPLLILAFAAAAGEPAEQELVLDERLSMGNNEMGKARGGLIGGSENDLVKVPNDEIGKDAGNLIDSVAGRVLNAAAHLANIASSFEAKIAAGATQQGDYFVSDNSLTQELHLSPMNQDAEAFLNRGSSNP